MKNIYYKIAPAMAAATLLFAGCHRDKPTPEPPREPAERVFLMYDNIGAWFDADVMEAGKAVAAGALDPADRVVVYERMSSGNVIYELVRDESSYGGYKQTELKKYAEGENNSLDAETIAGVVGDVRALFPDAENWGFAFGSHGMGWIPKSNSVQIARGGDTAGRPHEHPFADLWAEKENPRTRFFMSDKGQKLDVSDFVDALDGWTWNFMILDDCFMASVEALYEMRTLADYIIASPTEIMIDGFPYDRVVNSVFDDWSEAGFIDVGAEYVDYYEKYTGSSYGTIAVVKTSELDALAETVRKLNLKVDEITTEDQIKEIQFYEGINRPDHVFYDFDDYMNTIRAGVMPSEYNAFKAQLERTVKFADHTDSFYSDFGLGHIYPIDETKFSGINVFIPWSETVSLVDMYRQTEWYKEVYTK